MRHNFVKYRAIAATTAVVLLLLILTPSIRAEAKFVKVSMPDLGQHSSGWCWVTAAANSFYWFSQHGYPELLDDPATFGADKKYITDPLRSCPGCPSGGYYRLLEEICLSTWHDSPPAGDGDGERDPGETGYAFFEAVATNHDYICGLRAFIAKQDARLEVEEIWGATFQDYQNLLKKCEGIILWLESYGGAGLNHFVTGVSFDTTVVPNTINVSDPWTPSAPDHNNDLDHDPPTYDTWEVVTGDPFVIGPQQDITGGPKKGQDINVGKIICICKRSTVVFTDPPKIKSKVIGETVTVNINVSNVNDLYGWQAGITFNPHVLECTGYYEGEFLQRGGPTYWIYPTPTWDNTKGIAYTHGCTLLGSIPGVSGSGQLGYLTFEVIGTGVSDLHLINVKFVDSNVEVIQHEVVDIYTVSLGSPEFSVETISNLTAISGPPYLLFSGLLNHTFSSEEKAITFDFVTPYDNFYIVTIPKTLLSCANLSDWTVEVDGEPVPFVPIGSSTQTSIYFTYHNSSHEVKITGTTVFGEGSPVGGIYIPVNKLGLLAPYIGLTILLTVAVMTVVYVKKRKRHTEINS